MMFLGGLICLFVALTATTGEMQCNCESDCMDIIRFFMNSCKSNNLNNFNTATATQASGGTTSTYIRWGRTTCPGNGSELLYAGYMAGLYYEPDADPELGHGGNYLCLPYTPSWNHYTEKIEDEGFLTGVEYSMWPQSEDGISEFFCSNIRGQQAPCSVCRSVRYQVMIPGRSSCYDGWTMEYTGYLVFGLPKYNEGNEFVCLDHRPEHAGGSLDYIGKNRLYLVEAQSDFGLDESYPNGREIACVVCSI